MLRDQAEETTHLISWPKESLKEQAQVTLIRSVVVGGIRGRSTAFIKGARWAKAGCWRPQGDEITKDKGQTPLLPAKLSGSRLAKYNRTKTLLWRPPC